MEKHPDASTWLREPLRKDGPAGIVVFLVALPLCLGIALASGAPLMSGILTGIIGGIVVGLLSGSQLSVSGPAAGLTVIVAGGITKLGSFDKFLTAVFLAGGFQILFFVVRAGALSGFFPNSVIHGMLAAIGVIIILKQIPHALGRDTDYEGDLDFWNITDQENTLSEIVLSVATLQPNVVVVSTLCLAVMIGWPKLQARLGRFKLVPAPLVAVIAGVVLNEAFRVVSPGFEIASSHLVQLPSEAGLSSFFTSLQMADFSVLGNKDVWITAVTIAIVGSIETLLCLEATDRLDPLHRTSNPDRELLAQGVGNTLCGLVGGIPMTSVIVRSSANIYAGARSRMSAVFHGLLLLASVLFLASVLNRIPLGALAAVLFVVGYKLTRPQLYREILKKGADQAIPFLVTCITVVFTDLLTGVGAGLVAALVMVAKTNHYGAVTVVREGKDVLIRFSKDVSYANKVFLRSELATIPEGARVVIDGTRTMFIDNDIYDVISDFQQSAKHRDIIIQLKEIKGKRFTLVNRRRRRTDGLAQASTA